MHSNSNSLLFFVSQIMAFSNSQNNMGKEKRGYLQEFGIIELPKSKVRPIGQVKHFAK
jgi:hypothetical protein